MSKQIELSDVQQQALLEKLKQSVEQMPLGDVTISEQQLKQCIDYLALLCKWNKAYNLTAIREPNEMLVKHLLDSIVIAPYIKQERLLDVGTGAGLPGFILAILFPQKQFTLLDSNGKKIRFLQHATVQLGMNNVSAEQARVESYTKQTFSGILSRAFASISDFVNWCEHACETDGVLYAMKGVFDEDEWQQAQQQATVDIELEQCIELDVPSLDAQRHLLVIKKRG